MMSNRADGLVFVGYGQLSVVRRSINIDLSRWDQYGIERIATFAQL